ncbi:CPBP family intramembrane metalloprotease, partial [Rhodococcus sp. PAE-6]|nr:CPBP family intramembrane metalloprotease [Rhodococcus sp. PAE-6]
MTTLRDWLRPASRNPAPPLDPTERRALWIEITIVVRVTFGLSGSSSLLS